MSQSTTTTVNHYADLILTVQTHCLGSVVIVDFFNDLYFSVVVPSAQRSKLLSLEKILVESLFNFFL